MFRIKVSSPKKNKTKQNNSQYLSSHWLCTYFHLWVRPCKIFLYIYWQVSWHGFCKAYPGNHIFASLWMSHSSSTQKILSWIMNSHPRVLSVFSNPLLWQSMILRFKCCIRNSSFRAGTQPLLDLCNLTTSRFLCFSVCRGRGLRYRWELHLFIGI